MDKKKLKTLPPLSGVYLMKNGSGKVLYVGKAKNLNVRVRQYFNPGQDGRDMIPYLTAQVTDIETIVVPNEKEALLLENTLIKRHKPKYNVLLKDDKTFISLMVNNLHKYPRVTLIRSKGKPKEKGLYFGPYTSAYAARHTLEVMQKLFPLRQCSDRELVARKRPCLLYSIKRCIAPCVHKCSDTEYAETVGRAIRFLKGDTQGVLEDLREAIHRASENLEYEKAANLLTSVRQLEHITTEKTALVHSAKEDCDAFALKRANKKGLITQLLFREGRLIGAEEYSVPDVGKTEEELWESFFLLSPPTSKLLLLPLELESQETLEELLGVKILCPKIGKKKALIELAEKNAEVHLPREDLLLSLQEHCSLSQYPAHIECFDTSNIAGTDLVASMVCYIDGRYAKQKTRLFRIKHVEKGDDYAAMREVLTRHYTKAKNEDALPNLIIVDGGKGQLNVAKDVLKELSIATVDLISIVKEDGRHDKGLSAERIFTTLSSSARTLPIRSPLLHLLQKIRDEAHRVAIGFHRKRRTKRVIQSKLDNIPGIGPVKKKRLLKKFGSMKRIEEASKEEILEVQGLTEKDYRSIKVSKTSRS